MEETIHTSDEKLAELSAIFARGFLRMRQKSLTGAQNSAETYGEIAPPDALKMLEKPCSLSLPVNGRRVASPITRSPE